VRLETGTGNRFISVWGESGKEKNFYFSSCWFVGIKTGRENFGLVKNKDIILCEEVGKIVKVKMVVPIVCSI